MAEKPEHVEMTPGGIAVCKHCCGPVSDDGYSSAMDGDSDAESEVEAAKEGDTGNIPEQHTAADRLFADAVRGKR